MKVLITGGANGIGKQSALELAERHEVAVFDRDEEALEDLPEDVDTFAGDVSDTERVREVIEDLEFDVLVNCAGYYELGALEDVGEDTAREIYDSNVFGPLNFIRESTGMLREREGRIVNVSSVAGKVALPYYGIYCSTKHALEALSDSQRMELHGTGVEVVLVEPGPIDTGFNRRAREALEKYLPDSFYSADYRELMGEDVKRKNVEKASEKVVKAVKDDSPSARYKVGWEAWIGPKLKAILPTSVSDRILRDH